MGRSGQYVTQITGYKAFMPSPLPPSPDVKIEGALHQLLANANIGLGRLDTMRHLLPNLGHIIAMYTLRG